MNKKPRRTKAATKPATVGAASHSMLMQRSELALAVLLTLIAVALHIYRAGQAGGLWRDEVSTVSAAMLPTIGKLWDSLIYESSFPLMLYGIVRVWAGFGNGDFSLRILGALIGIGVLAALWLTKWVLGRRPPMLALAFLGLNAAVIRWGDALRAYGLATILILLVYGCVWRVVESLTPKRLALAGIVTLLSVQALYQNAFLVLVIYFGAFLVCVRKRQWKTMLSLFAMGAVSALSLLPYLPKIAVSKPMHIVADLPAPFSYIIQILGGAVGVGSGYLLWIWVAAFIFGIAALGYSLRKQMSDRGSNSHRDRAIYSLAVLVAAPILYVVLVKVLNFEPQPWYFVPLIGIVALALDEAAGLTMTSSETGGIALAVVMILAVATVSAGWKQLSERQTNIDLVAETLTERASDGDYIVVAPWFYGITFHHYYRGSVPWTTAAPISDTYLTRYDLLKEQIAKPDPLKPVFEGMEKALSSGKRVWVVGDVAAPSQGQPPPALPPAPGGPHGWYSGDYISVWMMQLGYFLQMHTTAGGQVPVPVMQPVSTYEKAPLWAFQGWRP